MNLRSRLNAFLERLAGLGALPTDDEETRLRKALTVLIAIVILPVSLTWAALYLAFGAWTGWVAVAYFAISVASIALFARTKNYELFLNIQLVDILLSPTLSMIAIGGFLPDRRGGDLGDPCATRRTRVPWPEERHEMVHRFPCPVPGLRRGRQPARGRREPIPSLVLKPDAGPQHHRGRRHDVHPSRAVRPAAP